MGIETLVKALPGAHVCAEYTRDGKKDYWLAAEWDLMKAVVYSAAGIFGYAHLEQIANFLQQ
ncbi:hypothetical protein J4219_07940 [Candidatus Woesearchaeota archaeon]|nr:hypothetical protein [Candidatus Woesearchaeota archaeon]